MVKDAYKFALPLLAATVLLFLAGTKWPVAIWFGAIFLVLLLFVCYFFRDPQRTIPTDPSVIVSPADGKVVEIVDELLDSRMGHRISIFEARIADVVYQPGKFYAAFRSDASVENEQNIIYLHAPRGTVVFKQIAGAIARRVICWKTEGENVAIGEHVGLIRFGSRVDVWLPMDTELKVKRGDTVKGGESILARWN
jgi:phosphatidylserine decarboxylase